MKHLAADAVSALCFLAMTPLYWVVRRALRDELDCQIISDPDPNDPMDIHDWGGRLTSGAERLALAEEQVEVWEPYRMMRP